VSGGLKLLARDEEDLAVLSACLQDALIPISEMRFLPGERRFVFVANRFRWENCAETAEMPAMPPGAAAPAADIALGGACAIYERINSGVCFEAVAAVRRRGFEQHDTGLVLELLAIRAVAGAIELDFAGDMAIRLEGPGIACHMTDIGEPWTTEWRPRHLQGEKL
jgi:hypothetical protein